MSADFVPVTTRARRKKHLSLAGGRVGTMLCDRDMRAYDQATVTAKFGRLPGGKLVDELPACLRCEKAAELRGDRKAEQS